MYIFAGCWGEQLKDIGIYLVIPQVYIEHLLSITVIRMSVHIYEIYIVAHIYVSNVNICETHMQTQLNHQC